MVILGLILMVGTNVVVGLILQRKTVDTYRNQTYSYTRTAARLIDGNAIRKYLETGKTDDYYYTVDRFLNVMAEEAGIKYFYVVVPTEEDMIYIWDAEPGEVPLSFLEHDDYSEGGEENTMRVFRGDDEEAFQFYRDEEWYVATAMTPLYDSNGIAVAVVGADISIPGIWESFLSILIPLLSAIFLIMVIALLIYYFRVRKQIIIPITTLQTSAGELAWNIENETDYKIPVNTNDEFDDLARTYESMAGTIRDYIRQNEAITAERERIAAELDLAARIQADMLPNIFPAFPDRNEFDIYASMTPAKVVGGDFYDFFLIDHDHLGIVMADVSGKGIPAALFMMNAKTLVQNHALTGKSPKEVLESVNERICKNNQEDMFVTIWCGILDLTSGKLTATNAGHEYPALKTPDGSFELVHDKHGFVVGAMEGLRYKEYELQLDPGAKLFLYTDGVPEATNAENELFGTDRMIEALRAKENGSPDEVLASVQESVDRFVKEAPQFDDLTMLCLMYKGYSNK